MARIRTIKPDFFRSASVARLSYRARLTWQGLWTYADDEGRGRDDPRDIKGQIWSQDDSVTWQEVVVDMDELAGAGKLVRYEVDGERFFFIPSWGEHQKISKPTPSRFPEPSGSPPGVLPAGREGKREGNREGGDDSLPRCDDHRGMKKAPPCGACKEERVRREQAEKNKPTPTPGKRPRRGDGHACVDDGFGWCLKCQERMEQ